MPRAQPSLAVKHVVLLGDSVFDNGAYVGAGPDVIVQLRSALSTVCPLGCRVTLAALDGAVTADVAGQLRTLPEDATHLVVSAGGNDALNEQALIFEKARAVAEVLDKLARIKFAFAKRYGAMLNAVTARNLPAAVCTIYEARFQDPAMREIAATGLSVFNDVILREAFARGLPVIDLRLIFDDDGDYANDIEPSVQGGTKIARAIVSLITTHDFARKHSAIYV